MNELVGVDTSLKPSAFWLSEEVLLKLHLQLTLLAVAQLTRRDQAEDIASACLVDLWKVSVQGDDSIPVGPFLLERLSKRITGTMKKKNQQMAAEQQYIANLLNGIHEWFLADELDRIVQRLPLLEPQEQQILRLLIADGLSLEQIAYQLTFPIPKVNRLYKHAVFRLRKQLGLLKRYW